MANQEEGERPAGTLLLVLWQQVVAVGGSLSLAGILREFILWKEVFVAFIDGWVDFIRPISSFLFGWMFEIFRFELTPFWKDYLAIGLIFGMGFLRHFVILNFRVLETDGSGSDRYENKKSIHPLVHGTGREIFSAGAVSFIAAYLARNGCRIRDRAADVETQAHFCLLQHQFHHSAGLLFVAPNRTQSAGLWLR